jgi:hypothetical protein
MPPWPEKKSFSLVSELPIVVTVVAIIHPVVMIVAMMNAERSIDRSNRAPDRSADDATDHTADGPGGTIALVSPLVRTPHDTLCLSRHGRGENEQRADSYCETP